MMVRCFLHQLRRGEGGLCRAQSSDQEEKGEAKGCEDHPLERVRDSRLLVGASSGSQFFVAIDSFYHLTDSLHKQFYQ